MSGFSFGGISVKDKKRSLNQELISSPIIVDKSDTFCPGLSKPITVLVERYLKGKEIDALENFLKKKGIKKYIIMCTLKYDVTPTYIQDELHEGIIGYYMRNTSQFRKYIQPLSPILVFGPAIYSLLQEDDIQYNHCDQRPFCVSNFWFSYDLSSKGNYVYPVWPIDDIFADGFADKSGRLMSPVDSYRTNLAILQIQDILKDGIRPAPRYPKLNKIFIESKEDFYERFWKIIKDKHNEIMSWDLETSGFNCFTDRIGCITISFDGRTGWYIPWEYVDKKCLNTLIKNNKNLGANLKFDIKFLWQNGCPDARVDEDVYTIGHCLDETRSNSLKALAFYYTIYGGYERALDVYKNKYNIDNYLDIDEDILKEYAIMDAIVCRRIYDEIMKHLRWIDKKFPNEKFPEDSLEKYYYYRRIPANNLYADMEYKGICVNKNKLDKVREDMREYIKNLKKELCQLYNVAEDFDWSSTMKVGKLFKKLGYENLGESKAGEYKCSDDELIRWAKIHPEVKKLQTLRSLNTLINTFVGDEEGTKGWTQYMIHHPEDKPEVWRMHPSFNAMATDTHRTKTSKPNSQNVVSRNLFSKEIKATWCTPDDDEYYLVTCDMSALQLRLATINSFDEALTAEFQKSNADIHSLTGSLVFTKDRELDIETITVEQDGKTYEFLGGELVETKRGEIFARDLKEDDELII